MRKDKEHAPMSPTLLEIIAIIVLLVIAWQIGNRLFPMNQNNTHIDEHAHHGDEKHTGDGA